MPPFDRRAMASHSSSDIDAGRNLKRQKTRKGTRSCWACKRRKMKCTYASPADDVCIGCARRCLDCVGQEFPEQDPGPSSKSRMVGDRIGRLESMIQHLAEQVGGRATSSRSPSTPAGISMPVPPSMARSKHRTLSQTLLAAYPSPSDLRIIDSTGENLTLYLLQAFVAPSHLLKKGVTLRLATLWGAQQQQYTAEIHPVLIARQMLLLAGALQHLHAARSAWSTSSSYQQLGELSQPPQALARQLAEAATALVTAHDRFTTDTLEGLECLWLEAMYHEHNGSLRRSWLACRRAISAVHLMGYHGRRSTPTTSPKSILQQPDGDAADLQQIWLRLVHSELALCLALELPPSASCPDDTFTSVAYTDATEDDDIGTSELDRRHAAIASHLLQRSERDPGLEDLDAAHQIRTDLEEAASAMPSGWWRTPGLANHARDEADDDHHLFGAMMKLRAQIYHSYLLLLADLPYMLQETCGEPTITATTTNGHHHHDIHDRNRDRNHLPDSSRNTCVEASRDLLRRFVHLRSCERAAGYFRLLDHYAWLAAAMLLLALLLDDCQTATTTSLEGPDHQQHLSDRALASEAMERMRLAGDEEEDDGDEDTDYYSGAAANSGTEDLLPRLLALVAGGAAVVVTYRKPGGAILENSSADLAEKDRDTLVLPIPFVGSVSVAPQVQSGSTSREGRSLLSGTMGSFHIDLDDEAGPQCSDGDGEEEEEDDNDLMRAIKMRRSAQWAIAHYMLRPV